MSNDLDEASDQRTNTEIVRVVFEQSIDAAARLLESAEDPSQPHHGGPGTAYSNHSDGEIGNALATAGKSSTSISTSPWFACMRCCRRCGRSRMARFFGRLRKAFAPITRSSAQECGCSHTSNKPNRIMTKTATIKVNDADLAYRARGEGPAIVLIGGIAAADMHWAIVIAELAKLRAVISLEYPGSGDTTDDGSPLSLRKLARQVAKVARTAGTGQFDLVGHSLGAAIAVELAAAAPVRRCQTASFPGPALTLCGGQRRQQLRCREDGVSERRTIQVVRRVHMIVTECGRRVANQGHVIAQFHGKSPGGLGAGIGE